MDRKTYLSRYRVCVDRLGIPVIIRRSADEGTFQADDLESGHRVALQLMPTAALSAADREQLTTEARAASQIKHINIPILRDFGFANDELVYVTEYLEGTTAEDRVKAKGPIPASAVLRIASQMVSALVAASLHGILHYAVNPASILLAPGETAQGEWPLIKVLNLLGVAPAVSPPGGSSSFDPADFFSPEQSKDGSVTFRSEIYSLGCTLWFLLKGEPLIGGAAALPEANGVTAPVRQLLAGMLAENPAERVSDPFVLQNQIQNCIANLERQEDGASTSTLASASAMEPARERATAWKYLAVAAVLIALAALAGVFLAQREGQIFAHETSAPTWKASPRPSFADLPEASALIAKEPTQTEPKPSIFMSNVDARQDEKEPAITDAAVRAESDLPPQVALANVPTPKTTDEVLPAAPLRGETTEDPAPLIAENSLKPEPRVELPTMTEGPPPAEGPGENFEPNQEISPPLLTAPAEEDVQKDVALAAPQMEPEKTSTPAVTPARRARPAAVSPSPSPAPVARGFYNRQILVPSVGHIFPPGAAAITEETKPKRSAQKKTRSSKRQDSPPTVGHIFPPVERTR
jgi:serine/threonine protein kinase